MRCGCATKIHALTDGPEAPAAVLIAGQTASIRSSQLRWTIMAGRAGTGHGMPA
ncbi:hypothetical protein MB901379_01398 [Mycobacterium basiliense]|uniref:Uncharacterized protein n=1 Tax=Mycobacterium basiliense TaxID=2094119 RepID=A0A3S4BD16_9MYCO|nr:hypothetical protein MB901379_01398 [Mycobacterium basiliense]